MNLPNTIISNKNYIDSVIVDLVSLTNMFLYCSLFTKTKRNKMKESIESLYQALFTFLPLRLYILRIKKMRKHLQRLQDYNPETIFEGEPAVGYLYLGGLQSNCFPGLVLVCLKDHANISMGQRVIVPEIDIVNIDEWLPLYKKRELLFSLKYLCEMQTKLDKNEMLDFLKRKGVIEGNEKFPVLDTHFNGNLLGTIPKNIETKTFQNFPSS